MSGLQKRAKQYVKVRIKQARRLYLESFHAFSATDLARALGALGIGIGDTILVHSSFDAFQGFRGKPTDIIAVLESATGETGAVLMPTLPFAGTAIEYARTNPVFDVRRTPSRTGLISELFRRSPGVLRSIHPTHPVAVWGRDATALTEGHYMARTPCGRGSPFVRLLEKQGKILLLGTDIGVLTFYHAIEELLENKLPVSPFTEEEFVLQSRDYSGNIVTTRTRLFEPALSRRRNVYKLVPELQQSGGWRQRSVGRLDMVAMDAEAVVSVVNALANRGIFCYD
jgi:aminoglycoside N3'-acetyltransferase